MKIDDLYILNMINKHFAGFEEAMRRREHEYRTQADEMSAAVLGHEMKVWALDLYRIYYIKFFKRQPNTSSPLPLSQARLLGKEQELLKRAQEVTTQDFEQVRKTSFF